MISSFQLASVSLWHTPDPIILFSFFSTSLFPGTTRFFRLILHISCLSPEISHFSKEPWLRLSVNVIRKQDLHTILESFNLLIYHSLTMNQCLFFSPVFWFPLFECLFHAFSFLLKFYYLYPSLLLAVLLSYFIFCWEDQLKNEISLIFTTQATNLSIFTQTILFHPILRLKCLPSRIWRSEGKVNFLLFYVQNST